MIAIAHDCSPRLRCGCTRSSRSSILMSIQRCVTIAVGAAVLLLLASTAHHFNHASQSQKGSRDKSNWDGDDDLSSEDLSASASASSPSVTRHLVRHRQRRQDDAAVADRSSLSLQRVTQQCLEAIDADAVHCWRRVNDCWQNDECTATSTSLWNVSRGFLNPTPPPHAPCAMLFLVPMPIGC